MTLFLNKKNIFNYIPLSREDSGQVAHFTAFFMIFLKTSGNKFSTSCWMFSFYGCQDLRLTCRDPQLQNNWKKKIGRSCGPVNNQYGLQAIADALFCTLYGNIFKFFTNICCKYCLLAQFRGPSSGSCPRVFFYLHF